MSDRNLIARVGTVLVLLPGVLFLIWRGGLPFALLLSAVAAICALELNGLPRPQLTAAAVVSAGGAFLIPILHEVALGWLTVSAVLSAVVILASADALLFEAAIPHPRRS